MGAYGWVAGLPAMGVLLGPGGGLAGFQWKPLDFPGTQPPFCNIVVNQFKFLNPEIEYCVLEMNYILKNT